MDTFEKIVFSWYDYILFSGMLGLSVLIGVYFGCFGTKQSTVSEYFLGEKKMKILPIILSLISSNLSGISLLAIPADVYTYGAPLLWSCVFTALLCPLASYIFLPVFYNADISSAYEYLQKRFNHKMRMFASFLFTISAFTYYPIIIYVPALAFEAVTNINAHVVVPILCALCIFYTALGGLKAVVWTDTIQFILTVGSMIMVVILGIISAGGFENIWVKSLNGHRLDIFDFDWDPTKRDTFWTIVIGHTFGNVTNICINPSCVQKYLSLSTLKKAKLSMIISGIEIAFIGSIIIFIGLTIFATYHDCDPFSVGLIEKNDQLLPYFVLDIAQKIPGLTGLFIAGIFCASLSTFSAGLNCLAGTIYNDFVLRKPTDPEQENSSSFALKIIVAILGIICTGMVYVIENLGNLWPLIQSLTSITTGSLTGLFILGIFNPVANIQGALLGSVSALVFMIWIVVGNQYYSWRGLIHHPTKPFSTDGCVLVANTINNTTVFLESTEPFVLYRISFYYYTLIGTIITVTIGSCISLITNKNHMPVHKNVLSPLVHFWVIK